MISPFTATTTPTALRSRNSRITFSKSWTTGAATASTRSLTSWLSITRAYEVVPAMPAGPPTVEAGAEATHASLVWPTRPHTCFWLVTALADPRTVDWAIAEPRDPTLFLVA